MAQYHSLLELTSVILQELSSHLSYDLVLFLTIILYTFCYLSHHLHFPMNHVIFIFPWITWSSFSYGSYDLHFAMDHMTFIFPWITSSSFRHWSYDLFASSEDGVHNPAEHGHRGSLIEHCPPALGGFQYMSSHVHANKPWYGSRHVHYACNVQHSLAITISLSSCL